MGRTTRCGTTVVRRVGRCRTPGQVRLLAVVLACALAATAWLETAPSVSAEPVPTCGYWYDYAGQWTSHSSTFYHPGSGCIVSDGYYGWVGINGQIQAPPHYPNLCCFQDTANHSAGWLEMAFGGPVGWIQIGWLAGCINLGSPAQVCGDPSTLTLYDESVDQGTNPWTIVSYADGQINFNATEIVNVILLPQLLPKYQLLDCL